MATDPTPLSLAEVAAALSAGETSSVEATRAYLDRIGKLDKKLNSYLLVDGERALEQAKASDERRAKGRALSSLDGAPLGIKDVIVTHGLRTTAGSKILENFRNPPFEATVMRKLREAGAVALGKLNMDEFAMGSSTENSAFGPTLNPWDLSRTPGGSSGGSAAAVAAGLCAASLGTDTGGSIRQPAALCGVSGIKPTYGRVSRYGVIAYASSLDQVGPFGRSVEDCALLLQAVSGYDPLDSTSLEAPVPDFTAASRAQLKDVRLGVPRQYFVGGGLDAEVEKSVRAAIARLQESGAKVVEVDLPHTPYAVACYYLVATAEASSNLARYDGVRYGLRASGVKDLLDLYEESRSQGFGAEVKRRIMLGTFCLSAGYYDAYYKKAQQVRRLIQKDFLDAFGKVDAIVGPVSPTAAFKIGEKTGDPLQMYLSDIYTIAVNLAGLPGMSVPCGFTGGGLPVGLQIISRPLAEETVFRVAGAYERSTDWHRRRPALG